MYVGEVSIFFDLFSPSNRHRTEELRRLENTREEEAQGERARGPIDLSSGTVVIRSNAPKPAQAEADEADGDEEAAADDAVVDDKVVDDAAVDDAAVDDTAPAN